MGGDLARLVRADQKFGIVFGRRNLMALDFAGRSQLPLNAAGAPTAALSPSDPIAGLELFGHAVLRTKHPAQFAGGHKVAESTFRKKPHAQVCLVFYAAFELTSLSTKVGSLATAPR
jgi:hypothetical protein